VVVGGGGTRSPYNISLKVDGDTRRGAGRRRRRVRRNSSWPEGRIGAGLARAASGNASPARFRHHPMPSPRRGCCAAHMVPCFRSRKIAVIGPDVRPLERQCVSIARGCFRTSGGVTPHQHPPGLGEVLVRRCAHLEAVMFGPSHACCTFSDSTHVEEELQQFTPGCRRPARRTPGRRTVLDRQLGVSVEHGRCRRTTLNGQSASSRTNACMRCSGPIPVLPAITADPSASASPTRPTPLRPRLDRRVPARSLFDERMSWPASPNSGLLRRPLREQRRVVLFHPGKG